MIAQTVKRSEGNDRRSRRWVTVFVLIGILEVPYLMWPWIAPLLQPKRFTNHHDQIAVALRQHGVSFDQVYVSQGWPDQINNQTYGANLTIYVTGSTPVSGRIECRVKKRNCWFQVARLGIGREDLSDLISITTPENPRFLWSDRLSDILDRLGVHL